MKIRYDYVKDTDVKACKALARILIQRDFETDILIDDDEIVYIAHKVCKFFDTMYGDFRIDFEEWIKGEVQKKLNKMF